MSSNLSINQKLKHFELCIKVLLETVGCYRPVKDQCFCKKIDV